MALYHFVESSDVKLRGLLIQFLIALALLWIEFLRRFDRTFCSFRLVTAHLKIFVGCWVCSDVAECGHAYVVLRLYHCQSNPGEAIVPSVAGDDPGRDSCKL